MTPAPHDFEAVTTAYAQAVFAKEPDRLAGLYAAEVRVFDAWGRWSYEGLEAWRTNLEEWLDSLGDGRVRVSFDDVVASAPGDLGTLSAIVTYAEVDADGEAQKAMQNRLTWVLARRGEGWAIVHEHTSAPIGFSDQRAILERE